MSSVAATSTSNATPDASQLHSWNDLVRTYRQAGSAQVLAVVIPALVSARLIIGGWDWADVAVVATGAALVGPTEWFVHKYLLHATEQAPLRALGVGTGHSMHHKQPTDVEWLLLTRADAAVFSACFAVFTAVWAVPVLLVLQQPVAGPYTTALIFTLLGFAHYEWVHLMVHSRFRPRLPYYARLARNHRLHHYRNERYWLGVTSNLGDRVFGTLPAKSEVPLSNTTRTLADH